MPDTEEKTITLVIPALNEEDVVRRVVEQILREVRANFRQFEVILVDDGSTDATGQIMDELAAAHANVRVLHNETNLGLGASYKRGVAEARYDYLMLLCGDGGMPAASLPPIFAAIGTADIVVPNLTVSINIGHYTPIFIQWKRADECNPAIRAIHGASG